MFGVKILYWVGLLLIGAGMYGYFLSVFPVLFFWGLGCLFAVAMHGIAVVEGYNKDEPERAATYTLEPDWTSQEEADYRGERKDG